MESKTNSSENKLDKAISASSFIKNLSSEIVNIILGLIILFNFLIVIYYLAVSKLYGLLYIGTGIFKIFIFAFTIYIIFYWTNELFLLKKRQIEKFKIRREEFKKEILKELNIKDKHDRNKTTR